MLSVARPHVYSLPRVLPLLPQDCYVCRSSSVNHDGLPKMPIWTESECETFFADGQTSTTERCQVRIADGRIVVAAGGPGGSWMYQGEEVGPEHFRLTSPDVRGTATLHRFDDDNVLDGWWRQERTYGMWRITLSRPEDE